ncbi:hypothetical protein NMG60_11002245 [Bertholletia excelsa]
MLNVRNIMDNFKHRKFNELQDSSGGEDKISNLPDSILHQILSFLPTKDAVATCILSTRWKFQWASVSNIDFDDSLLYSNEVNGRFPLETTCFMNFVERVLLLRDGSDMQKFRLSCRVCFNASRIHAWVSAAIKHKVQELDLCLFVEKPFALPRCVFDSESLTTVKIEMNCILELPACISLPRLKTLHLALVTFLDDDSTQKLLSSCPVLQDLTILDCEWMNLKRIMISIPTLKTLTIDDLPYFGSADELNGCEIKVDVENLIHLKYRGHLFNEILLSDLSTVVNASIDIQMLSEKRKEIAYRAVKLLRGLCGVKSIRISNGVIESLFMTDSVLDLPTFQNMSYLELSTEIGGDSTDKLVDLLQHSANVESLVFAEGFKPHVSFGEDFWILNRLPKCLLACLKSVSFHNFQGNHTEICFLKYLLKNALLLERLNVLCSKNPPGDSKKQQELLSQLQTLPKVSKNCVIVFS